ncbi:MAG: hypothetical protein QM820_59050 [Minicystis sp.]
MTIVAGCAAPPLPSAPAVEIAAPSPPPSATATVTAAPRPPPPPPEPPPCAPGSTIAPDHIFEPISGSFTAAGRDERVAEVACTPEGHDNGGHALLRHEGDAWKVVTFWPRTDYRVIRTDCRTLRLAEGRDLAVCRQGSAIYGDVADTVVLIDYAIYDEETGPTYLVSVLDNTGSACDGKREVVVGHVDRVEITDVDGDGVKDVRVTVRAAKVRIPKQPPCEHLGAAAGGPPPKNLPTPPLQKIDFITRGDKLVPTAAGARIIKAIEAMKPKD